MCMTKQCLPMNLKIKNGSASIMSQLKEAKTVALILQFGNQRIVCARFFLSQKTSTMSKELRGSFAKCEDQLIHSSCITFPANRVRSKKGRAINEDNFQQNHHEKTCSNWTRLQEIRSFPMWICNNESSSSELFDLVCQNYLACME